jgi:Mu transposase, C-terminal
VLVLGIRLVHSRPYSPPLTEGRGKQERLNGYIREAFLAEATHAGIESLDQLNDLFFAWAEQVANRRVHAETGQAPICRFEASGPPRQADPGLLREAFRWSVTRKVTRTATVPLEGNAYAVDPALAGRRVELRYDPEDLTAIEVFLDRPAGAATPFVTSRPASTRCCLKPSQRSPASSANPPAPATEQPDRHPPENLRRARHHATRRQPRPAAARGHHQDLPKREHRTLPTHVQTARPLTARQLNFVWGRCWWTPSR